ncbi:MAG: DUF370 domain-containing protein [Oscillospiraceae bacterium]|jgi:hypothetical protein|nr:DUF370 domain-containing protein [Oscillospiraceae bacterium]
MYLHLGCDTVIRQRDVVGIFDLDATTVQKVTREFLRAAQKRGEVAAVGEELPKSFVLAVHKGRQAVYLAAMGSGTLQKRAETAILSPVP